MKKNNFTESQIDFILKQTTTAGTSKTASEPLTKSLAGTFRGCSYARALARHIAPLVLLFEMGCSYLDNEPLRLFRAIKSQKERIF
jgi:hypothetical protein